jgi:hypothetical protein
METDESPKLPADENLPRPVVLRPEDLASVAAAGAGLVGSASGGRMVWVGPAPY